MRLLIRRSIWGYASRRRGAAVTETVLVLPLILVILSLLLFFGLSMTRLQRASVIDRYEAARYVHLAPGPAAYFEMSTQHWRTEQLNQTFFGNGAETLVGEDIDMQLTDVYDLLIRGASARSTDAGRMADAILGYLPADVTSSFSVAHRSSVPLWNQFSGAISQQHAHPGNDWKYVNSVEFSAEKLKWEPAPPFATPRHAVRDEFLEQLDRQLEPLVMREALVHVIRACYTEYPKYEGPDLPREWFTHR
jgi:hypothetical protein